MHRRILSCLSFRKQRRLIFLLLAGTLCISLIVGIYFHHDDTSTVHIRRREHYAENDKAVQFLQKRKAPVLVSPEASMLKEFICDSGKHVFNSSVLNDDYCDCEDGSDEPLTSACVDNKFMCVNEERTIPSSYVNDGICDCCDGSDEKVTINVDRLFIIPKHPIVNYSPCKYTCGT